MARLTLLAGIIALACLGQVHAHSWFSAIADDGSSATEFWIFSHEDVGYWEINATDVYDLTSVSIALNDGGNLTNVVSLLPSALEEVDTPFSGNLETFGTFTTTSFAPAYGNPIQVYSDLLKALLDGSAILTVVQGSDFEVTQGEFVRLGAPEFPEDWEPTKTTFEPVVRGVELESSDGESMAHGHGRKMLAV